MRVALVAWGQRGSTKVRTMAQALAAGLAAQGHDVTEVHPSAQQQKLTISEYVILITEAANFLGSRLPDGLAQWLSGARMRPGTRGAVFVRSRPVGTYRTLRLAMAAMETEGCYLTFSDVLRKPADAQLIGRALEIG